MGHISAFNEGMSTCTASLHIQLQAYTWQMGTFEVNVKQHRQCTT